MTDIPTPQNDTDVNISALEEELNKTITTDTSSFPSTKESEKEENTLTEKVLKLEQMEKIIEAKSHELESDIKTKLIHLRDLKQSIESELQKVKNFESAKDKIEDQIEKIRKLENEQREIDTEIKSIEIGAKELGI